MTTLLAVALVAVFPRPADDGRARQIAAAEQAHRQSVARFEAGRRQLARLAWVERELDDGNRLPWLWHYHGRAGVKAVLDAHFRLPAWSDRLLP